MSASRSAHGKSNPYKKPLYCMHWK
jgi:hypothetical protein